MEKTKNTTKANAVTAIAQGGNTWSITLVDGEWLGNISSGSADPDEVWTSANMDLVEEEIRSQFGLSDETEIRY